ncbi:MAG: hypothetical protein FGM24_06120 [Candidatus Kapabacteria bacterium]|nr:hypothetical protein [Candidatus Kapabacteria bacterium]
MSPTSSDTSAARLRTLLLALVPAIVYGGLVSAMSYVQDDAYITLAYARNVVDGHGPVFNIGEFVEGFTSPLWLVLSSIAIRLSSDPIALLQILGMLFAVASCMMVYRLTRHLLPDVHAPWRDVLAATAASWLAACSAFQFWSTSGMEVTLFLFLVAGMIDAFVRDRHGMAWVLWGAVMLLTRPEAFLVVGLLAMFRLIDVVQRREGTQPWKQLAVLAAVVAALELWRWQTYGALLPNTFSAKTTSLHVQVADGLAYAWQFMVGVTAYGAVVVLAALGIARMRSRDVVEPAVVAVVWTLAVILLGGDVLRHQRFLLPVALLLAPLMTVGAVRAVQALNLEHATRMLLATVAVAVLAVYAVVAERSAITRTIYLEGELVSKMRSTGLFLRDVATKEQRTLTVAATTIGALKWWSEQTVVDMLGLTDRTIATQPVRIAEVSDDATVSWKERKYNADYVIGRKPDFIVFSTGMKPSAFAERALFARQFYVAYYQYYYPLNAQGKLAIMYRRKPTSVLQRSPQHMIDLTAANMHALNDYARAIQLLSTPAGRGEAEYLYKRITAEGPANFSGAWQQLSDIYRDRGDYQAMYEAARNAVIVDPCDIRAHFNLFQFARNSRDSTTAMLHGDWIARCNPVLFRELKIPVPEGAY